MIDCKFPLLIRLLAPLTLAIVVIAMGGLILRNGQVDLAFWLFATAALIVIGFEVHKRSLRVIIEGETVEDRHLFGTRRLLLKDLTGIRRYRDKRLWLCFSTAKKPVWLLKGMGDLRSVCEEVLSRAQAQGATPQVVRVEE